MDSNNPKNTQYVQFGCGQCAPERWINFDASPRVRLMRLPLLGNLFRQTTNVFPVGVLYGNIVEGLPLATNSCTAIYSSHVIEHLCLDDCRTALRNVYDLLVPGGVFRAVLPDLEFYIKAYLNAEDIRAGERFMQDTLLGTRSRPQGAFNRVKSWFGHSDHLWMWDYKGLKHELESIGFIQIRRAEIGDADDDLFDDVEQSSRWRNALGVECRKPD